MTNVYKTQPFESAYGTIHLTPERYQEFLDIVNKHTYALMIELKERGIALGHLSLEKTSVWELEELREKDRLQQLSNSEINTIL